MLVKNAWDLVFGEVRPSDRDAFCLCVRHSAFYSASYNSQLQLCENATHLYKSIRHWVKFAIGAINIYAPYNLKTKVFFSYFLNNFAELFCASRKS